LTFNHVGSPKRLQSLASGSYAAAPQPALIGVSRRSAFLRKTVCVVLALGAAIYLAIGTVISYQAGVILLGILAAIGAGIVFVCDGGARITACGIYALAVVVFQGIGPILLTMNPAESTFQSIILAQTTALLTFGLTIWMYESQSDRLTSSFSYKPWLPSTRADRKSTYAIGLVLYFIGFIGNGEEWLAALPGALMYSGLCILSASAVIRVPGKFRGTSWQSWIPALVAFVLFLAMVFKGAGRLMVAGLGIVVFFAYNNKRPYRRHKYCAILALGPLLAVGAATRMSDSSGAAVLDGQGRGAGSIYSPIDTYALILEMDGDPESGSVGFDREYGATFLKALVAWVPRSLWSDKPVGLGFELSAVLHPDAHRYGHSDVGLLVGEFYINFGWGMLGIMPFVVAYFLRQLRRMQERLIAKELLFRREILAYAAYLATVSSFGELVWAGAHSWMARGGLALIICGCLSLASQRKLPNRTKLSMQWHRSDFRTA